MVKFRKFCFRFSSLFLVLAVVVAIVVPANASLKNWEDYADTVTPLADGNALVTGDFVGSESYCLVFDLDDNANCIYRGYPEIEIINNRIVDYHPVPFVPGHHYRITLWVFGYSSSDTGLDYRYMTEATTLTTDVGFVYDVDPELEAWKKMPIPYARYYYRDIDNNILLTELVELTDEIGKTSSVQSVYNVKRVSGATHMQIEYYWQQVYWESDPCPIGIIVEDFTWEICVPYDMVKDLHDRIINRQNEQIIIRLNDGNEKMEVMNSYFSQILNIIDEDGVLPEDRKYIEWMEYYEQSPVPNLGQNVSADFESNYNNITDDLESNINSLADSLWAVSWILSLFANLPYFSALLSISLALGLTGTILGIINTASRSRGEATKKKSKE